jgi:hypothetical protein
VRTRAGVDAVTSRHVGGDLVYAFSLIAPERRDVVFMVALASKTEWRRS